MRTERFIYADTIEGAAEKILGELKKSVRSRDNVFYFDGWGGLGASAVLRAVARRFTTATTSSPAGAGLEFEKVIHIDCSKWESRRALQRAVAEQLDLPAKVMDMFDREDEEDDFRGVARGSRAELPVDREMYQHIQNRRLLVIFHNGSNEEIDLASLCGFPLSGYSTSKVLWTFQGRFRVKPRTKVDTAMKTAGTTDVFLSVRQSSGSTEHWSYLVLQEAADVVEACRVNTGSRGIIDQPAHVVKCFEYMLELCCKGIIDYDLNTHGANYLACDSIIYQPQQWERNMDEGLWRSAQALQCEMSLDVDYHQYLPYPHLLSRFVESKPYWISPNYGFINRIPADSGDVFQNCADKLCVLKLSHCTFDFQSPPFLCCHNLRFLWLDQCQGTRTGTDVAGKEEDIRQCFQRLWVLDVRYTHCDQILSAQMLALMTQLRELNVIRAYGWLDMGQLQGRLPNIRKLRVKRSLVSCSCPENDLFSEMNKMEHLEFSGNGSHDYSNPMKILFGPGVSSSNVWCLETVVIVDGCHRLQHISFHGCTGLKNVHLGGEMEGLHTLDISGTAVKTLDLSTTTIYDLDELYLLDCEKLCAILWPPKDKMKQEGLGKLCIDTTQSAPTVQSREEKAKRGTSTASTGTSVAPAGAPHSNRSSSKFDWHISARDARLLASLEPVYSDSRKPYVEICPPHPAVVGGGSKDGVFKSTSSLEQQLLVNLQRQPAPAVYADITMDNLLQASEGDNETLGIMSMWPCPDVPDLLEKRCYIHIQDQIKTKLHGGDEGAGTINVPWFLMKSTKILHVHDSLSTLYEDGPNITLDEDVYLEWPELEWCRIERCPKLDFVFNNNTDDFWTYQLRIFWASQLLKSRYISTSNGRRAFPHLTLLHLDFCPRLIHVLSLTRGLFGNDKDNLRLLETLEIAWCGALREIFPFERDNKPNSKDFPNLKSIHLHELPSLQHICGVRMFAPNLETIEIRGCWSLRRLPDIGSSSKVVECDCEKEWWDKLEWDDRSQANNYRPIHPHHYKKTLLRASVLSHLESGFLVPMCGRTCYHGRRKCTGLQDSCVHVSSKQDMYWQEQRAN